ncbi:MAG: 3-phosphoserine/phosphohydroxythreonine transaminase [Candidatus Lightella neohaematopini]|nr:3-phosphoserine/phosphohydroxythreonine transaminase [Candidatus Lightella neohaematopini]MCV2528889.1 3-phosphoserine/phosphohydroxythreonine transaminase [Candidatus Lightella neohaematopini]
MLYKKEIFNFSASQAMIPDVVLKQIKKDLFNWNNKNISIMEINHRSNYFISIVESTKKYLRELLNIPLDYKIIFCFGGARVQFSIVPINLIKNKFNSADYVNSGYWSNNAINEAKKYCFVNQINAVYKENNVIKVYPMDNWLISNNSSYLHYCPNETVNGIYIDELPNFHNHIVVADCSSIILSRVLDISKFGIIYASTQKNIGLSGLTLLIIRNDLININKSKVIPSAFNYQYLVKYNSMFSTPPTFTWYVVNLILKWLKKQGGLSSIEKINKIKSSILYKIIDNSTIYHNNISSTCRSYTNITFTLSNSNLHELFLKESNNAGFLNLAGHRSVGGIRISLYNSMPLLGVKKLAKFMYNFSTKYS